LYQEHKAQHLEIRARLKKLKEGPDTLSIKAAMLEYDIARGSQDGSVQLDLFDMKPWRGRFENCSNDALFTGYTEGKITEIECSRIIVFVYLSA